MAVHASSFVGRERELVALTELGSRVARREGPAAAFIVGDPGSGKSRLLTEASSRIRLRQQLRIVGFEPARQVPLAAASDLLRAITAAPRDGPRLRDLLYESPEVFGRLEPLRIFEAAHRALRAFGPALIMADDLQWADEQTLALCHYLMRAAQTLSQPLGLIVASRPGPNADALQASLEQLLPRENLATIGLEPLSRTEGLRLATALAPGLPAERAEAVWARARGSPFWIEALVRGGASDPDLGNVLSARLHGVSADATTLFAVLCVAGRQLGIPELGHLLAWDPSRIDSATGQLINHGVIVQRGASLVLAHEESSTVIANTGFPPASLALAITPAGKTAYTVANTQSPSEAHLATIDLATGEERLVGSQPLGQDLYIMGMTFSPDGVLYAAGDYAPTSPTFNSLYTIDLSTGLGLVT